VNQPTKTKRFEKKQKLVKKSSQRKMNNVVLMTRIGRGREALRWLLFDDNNGGGGHNGSREKDVK
jgi:hypothetical protein